MDVLAMEALATEAPATDALATKALVTKSAGLDSGPETIMEDLAVDDGGVLVEDSDVDYGGASTYTPREVTASGIEKLRVGRQMASDSGLPLPYW